MKIWTIFFITLLFVRASEATPLRLHHRVVFTRGEFVWTMNGDGSDKRRVWRVPQGYGMFGCFSPDGKWALSSNKVGLYLHNLQTKKIRQILVWNSEVISYIRAASFSPEGKTILCQTGGESANWMFTRILHLNTEKFYSSYNAVESVTLHPKCQNAPSQWSEPIWSVNNKQIVAVGGGGHSPAGLSSAGETDIWIMNDDGTHARRLTTNPAWNVSPCLSPDGRKMVFARCFNTDDADVGFYINNLWLRDMTTGSEKALTFHPETYIEREDIFPFNPLFSPDGTAIVFQQSSNLIPSYEGIYSINLDGQNQKRLSDGQLVQCIS